MQNNYLSTEKLKIMVNNLPKDFTDEETDLFLEGLVKQGYILQNYNDQGYQPPKQPVGLIRKIGASIVNPVENVANTAFDVVGAGADHLGQKMREGMGMSSDSLSFQERLQREGKTNSNMSGFIDPEQNSQTRDVTTTTGLKQLAGDVALTATNLIPAGKVAKGAGLMTQIGKGAIDGVKIGGLAGAGSALQKDGDMGDIAMESGYGALTGAAFGGVMPLVTAIPSTVKKGFKQFTGGVSAPESVQTALNPFETESINSYLSVPNDKGLVVLKKVADITPEEKIIYQKNVASTYSQMLDRAKSFVKDRRDVMSPLEIVGKNTDDALVKVNKFRQTVGKQMGQIEKQSGNVVVDLQKTADQGLRELREYAEGKVAGTSYAGGDKLTPEMELFLNDLSSIQKNGNSVKEVLKFTRDWNNKLKNLKDKFGSFKENSYDNSLIERVVSSMKNQARDTLGEFNPEYRDLVSKYRVTSQLRDEGNRLMGKDGMMGEAIRGAATAKRAVQSNSDGGARQFYNKLKELTGYDGIQEADIAIQAMKDAGDHQGLDLLQVSKDILEKDTKSLLDFNVFNPMDYVRAGKKMVEYARPSDAERTKNFIGKDYFDLNKNFNTLDLNSSSQAIKLNNAPIDNPINIAPPYNKVMANNIPPAISNIFNIINQSLENGNLATVKTLLETLSPYAKTQLIKMLSEEYR